MVEKSMMGDMYWIGWNQSAAQKAKVQVPDTIEEEKKELPKASSQAVLAYVPPKPKQVVQPKPRSILNS